MSFLRHGRSIHPMCKSRTGSRLCPYSRRSSVRMSLSRLFLARCSPAAPASASPARISMLWFQTKAKDFTANGNLSRISLSHLRGALHPQVSRSDNSDPLFGKSHEVATQFGAFLSLSRRIESLTLPLD